MAKRTYGEWVGNPNGTLEDVTRCIQPVYPTMPNGTVWFDRQCKRKRGYGPGGLYCKQHAKKHKALPLNYTNDESGAA